MPQTYHTTKDKTLYIYTDGGCHGNPGPGAWAYLMRWDGHEKECSGYEAATTNNRMELTAALKALDAVTRPSTIHLYSDSQYLIKGMKDYIYNWKADNWNVAEKKKIKNLDLWKALETASHLHKISWYWVKGHSGHTENEHVDQLVQQAIEAHHLKN
tara:strand:+ start:179 stop:649 length:471 start_codon:yes stop_codon:yes gene_type:complete